MSSEHDVTRRQFLMYTLMGTGGFLAAGLVLPMARFAIDPLLEETSAAGFTKIKMKVDDLTDEPQKEQFTVKDVKDAWYTSDQDKTAFVFKTGKGDVLALSPICTHLGCTVAWSPDPPHPNEFHCPCHGSRFTKKGVAIKGLPAIEPLHVYETKVGDDGSISLGPTKTRDIPPVSESDYEGA